MSRAASPNPSTPAGSAEDSRHRCFYLQSSCGPLSAQPSDQSDTISPASNAVAVRRFKEPEGLVGGQFFKGYDRLVWCVIVVNAAGGMIVGMVRSQPPSPSAPQPTAGRENIALRRAGAEPLDKRQKDGE